VKITLITRTNLTVRPHVLRLLLMNPSVPLNVPFLRRTSIAHKVVEYAVICLSLDTQLKHPQEHLPFLPRQLERRLQPLSLRHQQEHPRQRQQQVQLLLQQQNPRFYPQKFHPCLLRLHHLVNQQIFLLRFHRPHQVCHPVENQRIFLL